MKKIRLFTLVALLITISVSTYADGKHGIRAGFQTSNLYNNGSAKNGINQSFYVGVFKEKKILPLLSLGTGLEYSQIGTNIDSDNKEIFHYLNVPINAKVKLGPLYAVAGASLNFLVSQKLIINGSSSDPLINANWFDIPVFAGAGFQFLMIRIEARYFFGTMSLYDSPLTQYKTQAFQLGLALAI